jgi:hypothetical protein
MEIITYGRQQDCNITIDDSVYRKQLPRTESGIYLLSNGEKLPEQRLLNIEDPVRDSGKLEFNLRNFYIVLMVDRVKKMFCQMEEITFRWKGRGVEDFEMDSMTDLGAFFEMVYTISEDKPGQRWDNRLFVIFHMERINGRLYLDFSQDRLYRWYVEKTLGPVPIINQPGFRELLEYAVGWDPFVLMSKIRTKKQRLTKELERRATVDGKLREAYENLRRANCYGLWS